MATKVSNFRLTEQAVNDLNVLAALEGTTKTEVLRRAIKEMAAEFRAKRLASAWSPRSIPTTIGDYS